MKGHNWLDSFESSVTILSFVVLGSAPQSIKHCMIAGAVGQMFSSRLDSFYTGNQYSSEPRDESFKPGGCLLLPENLMGETSSPETALLTDIFLWPIIFSPHSLFHLNIMGSLFLNAHLFLLFIFSPKNHNSLGYFLFCFFFLTSHLVTVEHMCYSVCIEGTLFIF